MTIYMQIPGVTGSVEAANYKGWIKVHAIDFGVKRKVIVTPGQATDREAGKPNVSNFVLTKKTDQSSPALFEAACSGTSQGDITIHACRPTKNGFEPYLQYTLGNVILSHYDVNGLSAEGGEQADSTDFMEVLHLNSTKVEMKYTPRTSTNQSSSPIITGYDLIKATKL